MGRFTDRFVRKGTPEHPRPRWSCPRCPASGYAANNADASAALSKHLMRCPNRPRAGGRR